MLQNLNSLFNLNDYKPQLLSNFIEVLKVAILDSYYAILFWVVFSVMLFVVLQRATSGKIEKAIIKGSKSKFKGNLFAAIMGAIPGCGGAIIMTSLYKRKSISFGMIVSVFIATAGDATIILISSNPLLWAKVSSVSVITAVLFGFMIDAFGFEIKNDGKLKKVVSKHVASDNHEETEGQLRKHHHHHENLFFVLSIIWVSAALAIMLIPAIDILLGLGILESWEEKAPALVGFFNVTAYVLAALTISMYILMRMDDNSAHDHDIDELGDARDVFVNTSKSIIHVSFWITIAVIILAFGVSFIGEENIETFFTESGSLIIVIAILVGLIPGCGPQIILTQLLLLQPNMPVAALYGNFITQDGDASFPLLVQDRRAAIIIKLINIIPAIIIVMIVSFTPEVWWK